jgi:mannose-6-phosphate isomerase-like protein (cupin superfamily)
MTTAAVRVLPITDLPPTAYSRELVGADHGGAGACLIFVDAPPGGGPSLHRHPYDEIFVVQEGEATFVADGEERIVRGGEIVIVPAGVAHGFVNSGDGPLRQIDIHLNAEFDTEWLSGSED